MSNPYQTPESNLLDSNNADIRQGELASRGSRFLSALVDGVIGIFVAIPFWMFSGAWDYAVRGAGVPFSYTLAAGVFGFLTFALIHYYFLNKNGQTIGKRLLNIRIVGVDDQPKGAMPLLAKRYLPLSIASLIPIAGMLFMLVDILFIFRRDRRCIHDLIAGTKVVTC